MNATSLQRHLRPAGIAIAVCGAALFVWTIRAAGPASVIDGMRRLGIGFAAVLLLGGLRHLVRTAAWRLCLDEADRPPFATAFAAYVAGDSIGNVTPFGFLISEPSKIVLIRGRVAPRASISALALENIFYSATVILMLVAGTGALLLAFPVAPAVRSAALATLAVALVSAIAGVWILLARRPVLTGAARLALRIRRARAVVEPSLRHVEAIETRVFGFAGAHRGRIVPILLLEAAYHVAAVAEIWIAIGLITGAWPSLLVAFVLEYVNRTITVVFQFVPMWLGVDEAGTGFATATLGLGAAAGVTLAVVRKARVAIWTAVGLALLFRHGLSLGAVRHEAELLDAQKL